MGWIGRPGSASAGLDVNELLARPVVSMSRGSQPYLVRRDVFKRADVPMGTRAVLSGLNIAVEASGQVAGTQVVQRRRVACFFNEATTSSTIGW